MRSYLKPKDFLSIVALNGHQIECFGECDATLKFGDVVLRHKLIVGELNGCEGILGVDILNANKGVFNFGGGYLDLQGHIIPLDHTSVVCTSSCHTPSFMLPEGLRSMVDCFEGVSLLQN